MKQIICAATLMALSSYVGAATVIGDWDDLSAPVTRYSAECNVNGAPAFSDYALSTSNFTATFTVAPGDTVECRARGDYDVGGTLVDGNWSAYLVGTTAARAPAPDGFSIIVVTD